MTEEEKQSADEQTAEGTPEEKPAKPRRARKKPEAEEATGPQATEEEATGPQATGDEAPEAEAEAEEPEAEEAEEAEEEPKPSRRRRRSSETATPAPAQKKAPAPRAADGTVVVRAQAKYVRHAPRKARLVVDHIRGKSIDEARAILQHTPRAAAVDVLKLLESAVANAENNHELVADDLVIRKAYVDEGPTLKRYRPRALGRATRIRKRTSHMTIQLSPKE
jgi:ribosomal protein L22